MTNELDVINQDLQKNYGYITKLIGGDLMKPEPITDDKTLLSASEIAATLRDIIKKKIPDYFEPLKKKAKEPYEQVLAEEKKWTETVKKPFDFLDGLIRDYNNRKRLENQAREQKEADERAAVERARLENEKNQLIQAGNEEGAKQIEEVKQNTVAGTVEVKKQQSQGDFITQSEKGTIEDFIIENHLDFATAMISVNLGNMIILDKKVETAFKKHLINNPGIKEFPGVKFRRDFKNTYRNK